MLEKPGYMTCASSPKANHIAMSDLPAWIVKDGMSIKLTPCLTRLPSRQANWLRRALLPTRLIGAKPQRNEKTGQLAWCYLASLGEAASVGRMLVIAITDEQGLLQQMHARRIDPVYVHGGSVQILFNASFASTDKVAHAASARTVLSGFNLIQYQPACSARVDRNNNGVLK